LKTIAISFTEGRVIRDFFENNLLDILQNAGIRVLFFTPAERVSSFKKYWENKGVIVYPLLPYEPSKKELRIENIRKRIKTKSTYWHHWFLKRYYNFFRTDLRITDILKKEKCDLVLITNPMYRQETVLWCSAKHLGIKTIGAVRSWDNLHQGLRIYPDELLVWNDVNKQEAINLMGYPEKNIFITGACQFDQYFNPSNIQTKEKFCSSLNLDPTRPIITLASIGSLWPGYDENYIVDQLIDLIESGALPKNPQLIIRLHPVSKYECFLPYLKYEYVRISNIPNQIPVLGWTMKKEEVAFVGNMLRYSDVVISPGSTITIETAIFDTPTLFPTYHTYQPEFGKQCYDIVLALHHKRLRDLKLINFIEKPAYLLPAIIKSLEDKNWFATERKQLFSDYVKFDDGKSTKRLFNHIVGSFHKTEKFV
jgi:hypothetical protein